MRSRSNRGYTLIEVVVASFMGLLVLGALISVFWTTRGTEREAREAFEVTGEATLAIRQLQEDLRSTSLSSIALFSGGFSLLSARPVGDETTFGITNFGVPQWQKYVYYVVTPTADGLGRLTRFEKDLKDGAPPWPAASSDDGPPSTDKRHDLVTGVLAPGYAIRLDESTGLYALVADGSSPGGLDLAFVRTKPDGTEELSDTNPTTKSDSDEKGWTAGSTRLVDLTLQVADISSESGQPSLFTLNIRVCPRN